MYRGGALAAARESWYGVLIGFKFSVREGWAPVFEDFARVRRCALIPCGGLAMEW
jgi:hypothetical protein